jgi:PKD repeat protein
VWDFGDGQQAGGADIGHTYTTPGTYTATVTVRDPGGLTDTESMLITVTGSTGTGGGQQQQQQQQPPGAGAQPPGAGAQPPSAGADEPRTAARVTAPRVLKVRQVIRRGVRLRVSCAEDCRARSVLRLSGERVGASRRLRIDAGETRTLVIRLERAVRRNLLAAMRQAGVRRVTSTAITTIATDDVTRAFPDKIRLRR